FIDFNEPLGCLHETKLSPIHLLRNDFYAEKLCEWRDAAYRFHVQPTRRKGLPGTNFTRENSRHMCSVTKNIYQCVFFTLVVINLYHFPARPLNMNKGPVSQWRR